MRNKAIGTYDIAKICHVTPATIGRWIEEGQLPYFTTGGGHRRVWDTDLIKFLKAHNIPIPRELLVNSIKRILIVDDEPVVRRSITRILKKVYPDIEIHEAKDGFEAGQKTGNLRPALVLLDLKLPGINGLEVCQMIRNDKNLRGIKILAMSGYNTKETEKQVLKSGADDFIGKPFESEKLIEKVQKLVPSTVKTE